ncbi:MAG: YdcF family protein, partial [Candidatus Peribacter sp.]|nr:YdcF family protein [Candidatus Peribacter sp.]
MKLCHLIRPLWWIVLLCAVSSLLTATALTIFVVSNFSGTTNLTGQAPLHQDFAGQGRGISCGLVFGAAVHKGSLPGPGIARRVKTATRLYHEGLLQHIILTGGKGEPGVASEAEVMRDVAVKEGIPAGDLTLEEQARSTWENLLYSRPLTGSCTTIIGISDRYHLARISFMAQVQGWKGFSTLPSDLEAPWYFEFRSISREVAALLYYIVLTHVVPLSDI